MATTAARQKKRARRDVRIEIRLQHKMSLSLFTKPSTCPLEWVSVNPASTSFLSRWSPAAKRLISWKVLLATCFTHSSSRCPSRPRTSLPKNWARRCKAASSWLIWHNSSRSARSSTFRVSYGRTMSQRAVCTEIRSMTPGVGSGEACWRSDCKKR